MPKPLQSVLTAIEQGKPPRVFLIGGNSEFLLSPAFDLTRVSNERIKGRAGIIR